MPSFQTVLRRISSLWDTNPADIARKVSEVPGEAGPVWVDEVLVMAGRESPP